LARKSRKCATGGNRGQSRQFSNKGNKGGVWPRDPCGLTTGVPEKRPRGHNGGIRRGLTKRGEVTQREGTNQKKQAWGIGGAGTGKKKRACDCKNARIERRSWKPTKQECTL